MTRKLFIIICLLLCCNHALGFTKWDESNIISNPEQVLDTLDIASDEVISGSVEKNIEMTLGNCIQISLGNNPAINEAFQDILIADSKLKQIWSNYFPVISWQTSYTHIKQLQLSDAFGRNLQFDYYLLGQISLSQLIYDFGVTQNKATIQRLQYESNCKTFIETVNDVIAQTKTAYYNVLYAIEKVNVAENTVEKYEDFYKQAKAFYDVGLNPKVDVTIALSNLSTAKIELIRSKADVNKAIAELNNIMGVPYIHKYKLKGKLEYIPINISFEDAITIANESRPDLQNAQILVEQAKQNLKLSKKAYFPILDAEGQYQRGGKHWTSNDGFNIGMFLNFPNINIAQINNSIKEARYLYDKQLASARKTQNDVYFEIQKAYLTLNEKSNQIPVSLIQLKEAQENYRLSFGRYRVGVASPIELREAENTLRNTQLTYFSSLFEYNTARAELERSIGKNIGNTNEIIEFNK